MPFQRSPQFTDNGKILISLWKDYRKFGCIICEGCKSPFSATHVIASVLFFVLLIVIP
jgi:hypothetical protein